MPSIRIADFDTWRPGYGLATVRVIKAGAPGVLAAIFSDEDLTLVADNPQTLSERLLDGVSYGRFSMPLYIGEPYQLEIDSVDQTGVTRPPLTTLDGEDASQALVKVTGGEQTISLADRLSRAVDVRDFGTFIAVGEEGASAATNTASLTSAVGAAGARGGGYVDLPEGTYQTAVLTIPQGVVIRGQGRGATILQSIEADSVWTIGGERAGFCRLTIDGITLVGDSIGIYAENRDKVVLEDVEVKRFETGIQLKGGRYADWRELFVSNCVDGVDISGVDDAPLTAEAAFHFWRGGQVDTCSGTGLRLKNDGKVCRHNVVEGVRFESNTGTAVELNGAHATVLRECSFEDNTIDISADDGDPLTDENTIIGLLVDGGTIKDGAINLTGSLEDVIFRRVDLEDVAIAITTPTYNITAEDCREISGITFSGIATAWNRRSSGDRGSSGGLTAGNAATKVWAITLLPGQRVYLEGKVVGRQRNGVNTGFYHVAVSAGRPGSSLAYDTQTANFTAGDIVTGATSGASARIAADTDSGVTGTLTIQDIVGQFVDDEIITDTSGGSATANGTQADSNAALIGSVTDLRAPQETNANWAATFVANGPQIELRVTGDNSQTVEWVADVDVVSS